MGCVVLRAHLLDWASVRSSLVEDGGRIRALIKGRALGHPEK